MAAGPGPACRDRRLTGGSVWSRHRWRHGQASAARRLSLEQAPVAARTGICSTAAQSGAGTGGGTDRHLQHAGPAGWERPPATAGHVNCRRPRLKYVAKRRHPSREPRSESRATASQPGRKPKPATATARREHIPATVTAANFPARETGGGLCAERRWPAPRLVCAGCDRRTARFVSRRLATSHGCRDDIISAGLVRATVAVRWTLSAVQDGGIS